MNRNKNLRKIVMLVCLLPIFILLSMLAFSFIGELLSNKSDTSVLVGVLCISLLSLGYYFLGNYIYKQFKTK